MLTTLANPFAYDQQRTSDTVPVLGSLSLSVHLFVGKMMLTALF